MRYYATCLDATGTELLLIAKAETEEAVIHYLTEKYNVQQVVHISTVPPVQEKNYQSGFFGVHQAKPIPSRTSTRRSYTL